MRNFMYGAIGLLCLVLIGIATVCTYNRYYKVAPKSEETVVAQEQEWTIDSRLEDIRQEKESDYLYNLCLELPEEITKAILTRIGANATNIEIANEYLRNSEYYISLQVKNNLPKIDGPDAANAKVKISTEIQRAEKEKIQPNALVLDSLK